jgi:hypothetical protein
MIKYNYIDLIKWAPIKWNQDGGMIIMNAIYYEQVDILEWCYSRCREINYPNTFEYAFRNGKIRSLQWFYLNAPEFEHYLCNEELRREYLNILVWVNSIYPLWYKINGMVWNVTVIEWARINGYTEILKWIENEGVPE